MTTTHTNCLHTSDKAGRTKCRAKGGPAAYAEARIHSIIADFECGDCATAAFSTAFEIMTSDGGSFATLDNETINSVIFRSHIWRYAEDIKDEFDSCLCIYHNPKFA